MNVSSSKSLAAALFATLVLATLVFAAVPQTISYQGYLKKGSLPASVATDMTFSLYSTTSGAGAVWTSNKPGNPRVIVTPVNGVYSVELGAAPQPALPAFDRKYWLGVQADADPEMRPLQPLTSVPYALRAALAESVPDGSITDAKLSGPISSAKIPDLAGLPASFAALQTTATALQTTTTAQQAIITQQQALIQTLQIQMSHINSPPLVSAGYDLHAAPGTMVMLYGKLSDTSPFPYQGLTWTWSIVSKPATSAASLTSTDSLVTVFTPDEAGTYTFNLTVSDGATSVTSSAALTVTAGMLGRAQLIETENTDDAQFPHVAMDAAGNAVAVWDQSDGTLGNIWANRYTPSGGWGMPQLIETNSAQVTSLPEVAMDSSGNAVAVWGQLDGSTNSIWANRYAPTTGWGTAQLIETNNTGNALDPRVAMDASGNAMVVWWQSNNIWANSSTPAGVWGTAQLIETNAALPKVSMGSAGIAIAVWEKSDGTTKSIWANRYTPAGGWGTAQLIETDNTGTTRDHQVAMDSSNNAVAVWGQTVGIRKNIWANRCNPAGVWSTAQLLETDEVGFWAEPQVAMSSAGNAVVVWNQIDGTFNTIWGTQYTTAGGWVAAQRIETGTWSAAFPQVAMDSGGNAVAIWQQDDGARSNTWANRYTMAGGWSGAQLIETVNSGSVERPQIAMSASGYAMAVWHANDGVRDNVWANTITVGWRAAQLIETDNSGAALIPQLAMNSSSNAVAVWQQSDGTRTNIWANRYSTAGGWKTAQLIETDNTGNAQKPQVAIDPSGNAVAVWQQYDNIRYNIWANRYTPAGGWGTAQLIETDNAGSAQYPQVRMDSTGNAIAIWQQLDGVNYIVRGSRYTVAGGWGAPQLIQTDTSNYSYFPQLAVNAAGNAVAVWQQYDGSRDNVWANRYVAGVGWGTAQLIENDNTGDVSNPQVTMDNSGNAMAVWSQFDGIHDNIWSSRYTTSGVWGAPQLADSEAGSAGNPQVVMDNSGNAVALWQQHDGSRYNIWANRHSEGVWGTARLIETDNTGAATNPRVSMTTSGSAVAVWQQSDGIRDNIWTSRYTAAGGWDTPLLIDSEAGAAGNPQVAIDVLGEPLAVWQQTDGTRTNIWSSRRW